jgi:hypothetical protein
MQAIVRLNIPQIFEPHQKVTYTHIAERIGVEGRLVRRLLKHAARMRIFDCSEGDLVGHTTASNQLRRPEMHDWMSVPCSEMWPSATRVRTFYSRSVDKLTDTVAGCGCISKMAEFR